MVKDWKFSPLISGTRQGCTLSPLPISIILKVLTQAIKEEKERKQPNWKGISKMISVHNDTIWYVENPKDSTKKEKLFNLINKFSKSVLYKINTQNQLYTKNKQCEIEIMKIIRFTVTSKSIKYLKNKVNKEGKNL